MRRPARGLGRLLVSLSLLAGLAGPNAATAAPPEGCIGFPDIPEAFVCITQWTPTNAVPTVSQGPGQTFVIPRFCVFECFGPTPVTVPTVVVTQGSGVVAVITYDGNTYPVTVPPALSPDQTIADAQQAIADGLAAAITAATAAKQQAEQVVAGAVATATAAADNAWQQVEQAVSNSPRGGFVLDGAASINCFGCGMTTGTVSGTGVVLGRAQVGDFSGEFTFLGLPSQCPVTGSATGTLRLPGNAEVQFYWTMVGGIAMITTSGSVNGGGTGNFAVTEPIGIPCGGPVTALFTAVVAGT